MQPFLKQTISIVEMLKSNQRMIEFDDRRQIIQACNSVSIKEGDRFKVCEACFIDSTFGLITYVTPDYAAHDRVQVIAVGPLIPTDQAAILKFIQHVV